MDGLLEFEHALGALEEADATPTKRPRHASGSPAAVDSEASWASLRRSTSGALASPDEGAGGRGPLDFKPPCLGCKRIFGLSRSWFSLADPVEWAHPRGAGYCCRDCFTAWRTLYSVSHNLVMFQKWLEVDIKFATWEWMLLGLGIAN